VNSHALHTEAFTVMQGDLAIPGTAERIVDEIQPDWVINCAALAIVDACETDPVRGRKLNTELPAKLASHVARGGARLLHVSTDAVFDGVRGEYTEDDETNPLSVYAQTKLDGEMAAVQANPDTLIARVNFYGWSLSGERSLSEFFFNNLQAGKQIMGFTDVYFCPLLVNDLANIFLAMLEVGLSGIYHVVSSESITKYEFGVRLAEKFSFNTNLITPASMSNAGLKATRSPRLTLQNDKLSHALGESLPGISAGLDRYHSLYKQGYPQYVKKLAI
jgi:dTDP-4-dehydrorhamnose reductase